MFCIFEPQVGPRIIYVFGICQGPSRSLDFVHVLYMFCNWPTPSQVVDFLFPKQALLEGFLLAFYRISPADQDCSSPGYLSPGT